MNSNYVENQAEMEVWGGEIQSARTETHTFVPLEENTAEPAEPEPSAIFISSLNKPAIRTEPAGVFIRRSLGCC